MLLRVLYGVLWVLTGSAGLRNGTMRCTADAPKKSSWLAGTAMALDSTDAARTYTRARTHTDTHTHTHARAHTHTRTHTHTLTRTSKCASRCSHENGPERRRGRQKGSALCTSPVPAQMWAGMSSVPVQVLRG